MCPLVSRAAVRGARADLRAQVARVVQAVRVVRVVRAVSAAAVAMPIPRPLRVKTVVWAWAVAPDSPGRPGLPVA